MVYSPTLLLLTLEFAAGYSDGFEWKLALNINPADGHNFGYGASAWDDEKDVGNNKTAFTADYKSYDVALETANFIAIVRHQDGVCEAARVWEFKAVGQTLHEYMNIGKTSRLVATYNSTFTYISYNMANQESDPIFGVDGALVFNWWHSDNGARIANSNTHCKDDLPSTSENSDKFFGLGNEIGSPNSQAGQGSTAWWSDVGTYECSVSHSKRAQGTDHGTSHVDRETFGQYAVYVSDHANIFQCEGRTLQTAIDLRYLSDFDRVEQDGDDLINFVEFVFDRADVNQDGVISRVEFSEARANHRFAKTTDDFDRVDRNGDGFLDLDEIEFDIADSNKDGGLSYDEYYVARVARTLTDPE